MSVEEAATIDESLVNTVLERWDRDNTRLKEHPQKDSRVYLKHAHNIIPLFEAIGELHPIAKVIVFSFKAVINFENDRIENDLRVTGVLLTQVNMMRVILDLVVIMKEQGADYLDSHGTLRNILEHIKHDIKEFGNAMDTYYKETRLVRFFKAADWKVCMTDFVQTFIEHSTRLQNVLAIQTLKDMGELKSSVNVLITQAFTPRQDWERNLRIKLKEYGPMESWIDDKDKVKEVIQITNDANVDARLFSVVDSDVGHNEESRRLASFIAALKEEIQAPLCVLFERNMDLFGQRLAFHTRELRDAIDKSADLIVRQLSGPYDRLKHEDLRKLWKEMNWIFCVEDKLFTTALFEYYLDHFYSKYTSPEIGSGEEPEELSLDAISARQKDIWTLQYLNYNGEQINDAVDNDKSGFIRISEVNTFTDHIPKGWTLPQWCAYVAVGWRYEQHIYAKRIQYLLDRYYKAQVTVKSENRFYVQFWAKFLYLSEMLSRGPEPYDFSSLPETFREDIRTKITTQDKEMRSNWKEFKFRMDDAGTVTMLNKRRNLDTYILQLLMLFLEHCLDLTHICETQIVDYLDWVKIDASLIGLARTVNTQIRSLTERFQLKKLDVAEAFEKHHGGLYKVYRKEWLLDEVVEWSPSEVEQRLSDLSIVKDFPLPEPNSSTREVIYYDTWEEYLEKGGDGLEEGGTLPPTWGVVDNLPDLLRGPGTLPAQMITCDNCRDYYYARANYCCMDCGDFDLCRTCFKTPFEKLDSEEVKKHLPTHTMVKSILYLPTPHREWMAALAKYHRVNYLDTHNIAHETAEKSNTDEGAAIPESSFVCGECQKGIKANYERLFKCLDHDCTDYYICSECEEVLAENEPKEPIKEEVSQEGAEKAAGVEEVNEEGSEEGDKNADGKGHVGGEGGGEEDNKRDGEEKVEEGKVEEDLVSGEAEKEDGGVTVDEEKPEEVENDDDVDEKGGREEVVDAREEVEVEAKTEGEVEKDGYVDADKSKELPKDSRTESPIPKPISSHRWWHTLLVLHPADVDVKPSSDIPAEDQPIPTDASASTAADSNLTLVEDRLTALEQRLEKVDNNVAGLKELISALLAKLG